MSDYRTRNRLVLAKVEGTSGQDASPTVANAVRVENPQYNPTYETVTTNEVTGSLDADAPVPGGGYSEMTFDIYARGAGTGNAGAGVEYAPLLKACGLEETLTASDVTDTLASATTTVLTLAAGASSTDDAYVGMWIECDDTTGLHVITDYDGTSKEATVSPAYASPPTGEDYTIYANALYKPRSTGLETITVYKYDLPTPTQDAVLEKIIGGAGQLTFTMPVRQPGKFSFNISGALNSASDVSVPSDPTYITDSAPGYREALTYLDGSAIKLNTLDFDLGLNVQRADDPANEYGYGLAGITERSPTGRINPPRQLVASVDPFTVWKNSTGQTFAVTWGSSAGNRLGIYLPDIRYTAVESQDINGFLHDGLPFRSVGVNSSFYFCAF